MNTIDNKLAELSFKQGDTFGPSPWIVVTQKMIDEFGATTLDPDPMHIDPAWAAKGPFGHTIAFGFLTISLLTHMQHGARHSGSGLDPEKYGVFLNYGFNRLRLVSPVAVNSRIRGRFAIARMERDERGRLVTTMDCTVEIEGSDRPALVAEWVSVWVPPGTL